MTDVLELARALVRLDTAGGNERAAAQLCADVLSAVGARIELVEMAPGRAHLLAHVGDTSAGALIMSGHLDTVPVGSVPWKHDPLGGLVEGDALYGRGSADMKAGVAALVAALERHLLRGGGRRGVLLALTAAEETGCIGARHLVEARQLPAGGPLLVAEPTGMRIATGHKGVLWLRVSAEGRSAHGSRPDLGLSAILPLARLASALDVHGLPGEHPVMGPVTVNVGTFHGGTRINLVPDSAAMELDIRVVPGADAEALRARVAELAGPGVTIETIEDLPPVYTEPSLPFASGVASAMSSAMGVSQHRAPLTYFTDASVLARALDPSEVVLLGPGEPDAAHTTDESCPIPQIGAALDVYDRVLRSWDAP